MIKKILERLEEAKFPITDLKDGVKVNGIQATDDAVLYAKAIEIVQEVAKECGDGWIPVETELPEENGYYTVTEEMLSLNDRSKVVGTRVAYEVQYDAKKKIWHRANTLRIIAWKKPIAPYQKGE